MWDMGKLLCSVNINFAEVTQKYLHTIIIVLLLILNAYTRCPTYSRTHSRI